MEDLQTRRTLAGDQPHLKGRRNLGDKPTIHHHDPGGRMGVFVVGEAAAAAQLRSSRAVGRPAGRLCAGRLIRCAWDSLSLIGSRRSAFTFSFLKT